MSDRSWEILKEFIHYKKRKLFKVSFEEHQKYQREERIFSKKTRNFAIKGESKQAIKGEEDY